MQKLPLDLVAYYEHQIRNAAQETGSAALLQNADRLLGLMQEETRGGSVTMGAKAKA